MRVIGLLLLVGCGRIGFSEGAPVDAGPDPERVATQVQGLSEFPLGTVDLGVSHTPTGFAVVFAEHAGSAMFGVVLDPSFVPDGDWRPTEPSFTYVGTTLAHTGTALVTTMTRDVGQTFIKRYVPDLSSYTEFDGPTAQATRASFVQAAATWFYVLADDTSVVVQQMDDGMAVGASRSLAANTTGRPLSGTSAGGDGHVWVVVERQPGTCDYETLTAPDLQPVDGGTLPVACNNPRSASNGIKSFVVTDDGSELLFAKVTATDATSGGRLGPGTQPRVAYDPDRDALWVAYLDAGSLALVHVVPGEPPITAPLAGLPLDAVTAYELVQRENRTFLVAIAGRALYFVTL